MKRSHEEHREAECHCVEIRNEHGTWRSLWEDLQAAKVPSEGPTAPHEVLDVGQGAVPTEWKTDLIAFIPKEEASTMHTADVLTRPTRLNKLMFHNLCYNINIQYYNSFIFVNGQICIVLFFVFLSFICLCIYVPIHISYFIFPFFLTLFLPL